MTTGVTHGGAGAESGGDSKGGILLPLFCGSCVILTGKAAGIVLRYKRFALHVLKEPFCGICDESHHEFVGSDTLLVPRVDPQLEFVRRCLFTWVSVCHAGRGRGSTWTRHTHGLERERGGASGATPRRRQRAPAGLDAVSAQRRRSQAERHELLDKE